MSLGRSSTVPVETRDVVGRRASVDPTTRNEASATDGMVWSETKGGCGRVARNDLLVVRTRGRKIPKVSPQNTRQLGRAAFLATAPAPAPLSAPLSLDAPLALAS